ncbi:MAG: class I SAM-dependent methyltransferase [Gaiella sp.]
MRLKGLADTYALDPAIEAAVTESTLSPPALRILGALIEAKPPHHVIEFGSGLSTRFFLQALRESPESHVYSIDDSAAYLEHTRATLAAEDAARVTLVHAPVRPLHFRGKLFLTYSRRALERALPAFTADLILIDGPPAFRYGREAVLYGALPWVGGGTTIVLDDAGRGPEQAALARWQELWGGGCDIELLPDVRKGLAIITTHPAAMTARGLYPLSECLRSWAKTARGVARDALRRH